MSKKITIAAIVAAVCLMAVGAAGQTKGSFTDPRDKKIYRTVRIGNRTWMAENLNYRTEDSWCYDNADSNCVKYGRLYNGDVAMKACPAGWRLPDTSDWNSLMRAVGGVYFIGRKSMDSWISAGTKLKSKTGWGDIYNGTDDFGFSAMPGGFGNFGNFLSVGAIGYWWSATGYNATGARRVYSLSGDDVISHWILISSYSVRCVRE